MGAKVLTLSDSSGFIYDKDGIDSEKLKYIMELKNEKRVRISEYIKKYSKAEFYSKKSPWNIKCDIAMGQGKKHRDQREDIKKRDWERDQGRILKNSKKFS